MTTYCHDANIPTPPEKDDDLLDDSAYPFAINSNPFDCTVNDKHNHQNNRCMNTILFTICQMRTTYMTVQVTLMTKELVTSHL